MSNTLKGKGDWSYASESLFRSARRAHDPTAEDRARMDAALAQALSGHNVEDIAGATHGARVRPWGTIAKLSLGAVCVAACSFAIMRPVIWSGIRQPHAATVATAPSSPTPQSPPPSEPPRAEPVPQGSESASEPGRDSLNANESHERSGKLRLRAYAAKSRPSALEGQVTGVGETSPGRKQASTPVERSSTLTATERTREEPVHARPQAAPPSASAEARATTTAPDLAQATAEAAAQERAPWSARTIDAAHMPDDARAELAVVTRMHAALRRTDFSSALALCAEHERRWPHGVFEIEREAVRAIAACGARSSDATARARRFLTSNPRAPVSIRVRMACSAQLFGQ